jgi:eukaryotic-like serine/threonine-protein kinase
MAEVFLAVAAGPAGFNKLSVVKLMKPELLEEPEHRAMFLDEGKLAARLNHPNIVQTHEVEIQGEQYFMAMEYLDGQPLHRILRRAHKTDTLLPLHWHLHFLCETLSALEYAHDLKDYDGTPLKVVHRDVTPHNVFVTYAGQVKLCDFGIAKTMASSVETRAGILRGKVAYMAPEQVMGTRIDRRADLFSVGVMLWEAVNGVRMWDGYSEIQIMQALSQGSVPKLAESRPDIDAELRQIIERALAPHPEQRFQSSAEFRRALEGYLFAQTARVDPRAVGDFAARLFEKERLNLQAVIQDQMTGRHLAPGGYDSLPPPPIGPIGDSNPSRSVRAPYSGSPGPRSGPASQSAAQGGSLTIPSVEVRAFKPRKTFAAALGIAAALSIALLFGVVALVVRSQTPDAPAPDVEPLGKQAAGEPRPTPTPETPSATGSVARVRIQIKAQPSTAKLLLDGIPVDNPVVVDRPFDEQDHTLEASADGYETETRVVRFDKSREVGVTLKKRAPGQPRVTRVVPKTTGEDDLPELKPRKKTGAAPLDTDDPWAK